ncbi:hypothetical protein BDN71DRAFT_1446054 [Pleurotus eryngii]|uniref:Uncharacterized protein n=1 Tax=Pleurotus eryngii TaxID=5323 RepID=A0A9P5ZZL5_PLEER|nr:hypothetical protein BDN71DRAFT_1446054 [Pleurotus eryngii]
MEVDPTEGHKHKSKHKEHKDPDRHSKKRHKHRDDDGNRRHHKKKRASEAKKDGVRVLDDDDGDDMWVEKDIDMDGERPLATDIPTAESLKITSSAIPNESAPPLPSSLLTESKLKRDEWMMMPSEQSTNMPVDDPYDGYGESSSGQRTTGGGVDFFSSLGTERKKKNPKENRPDPDKLVASSRELNQEMISGTPVKSDALLPPPKQAITPGGPGSQWRMMRLRRVYESAEEDSTPIEQVALERFGSLEAFEEAKEERRVLDEREGKRGQRGRDSEPRSRGSEREKRFLFNDVGVSGGSSRSSSFRRPGGRDDSSPSTPAPMGQAATKRLDSLRLPSQAASSLAQSHTPIPTTMTPPALGKGRSRALSPSSLNRLQAKVLRAKLMNASDADTLEKQYQTELRRSQGIVEDGEGNRTKVELLPTLDGRGRMYDVGHGAADTPRMPGNRRKKEKVETRDPKTGDIVRYNADDDSMTLGEMLRQEKLSAGMADQKNLNAQFAQAIATDGRFKNDLDYMDDNADKLGRQKMRSDAMKRQFAIHDYKRTQKALSSCQYCYGEDDSLPNAPVIAMGTRAYLSCTLTEELVPGHCLIVPIQHHLAMLEGDDDLWDEVRNFMKCLMRMFAEEDSGVVFYETVISFKQQRHTFIECVPMPWESFELIPGYFKESILASEAEWSQHKKLIDFSARPGGFRRAMVPNLPYFMVQFDYKGEKGYGHVIEGEGEGVENEDDYDEGAKGGGEFSRYFAGEIIGNILEVEPRKWRRPRRIDFRGNKERVAQIKQKYDKFDWTNMIGSGS